MSKYGNLRQDDASHWYLIPEDKVKLFVELIDAVYSGDYEAADKVNDEFGEYRLSGGVESLRIPMEHWEK